MGPSSEQPGSHSLWSGSDPHGQAALFLIDSLLHGLIEKSTLTTREALAIVDRAADVKVENATDIGDSPEALAKSLALIHAIAASLHQDIRD